MTKFFQLLIPCCLALVAATASAQSTGEPKPEPLPEQTWQHIRSLRGIATQDGMITPSLYVFFDPNCPYSAKLWQRQVNGRPFGEIPAVWVPVTFMSQTSVGKAVALLRANSKTELARNFTEAKLDLREGAATPVAHTQAEWLALGRTKAVWNKLGGGTPTLAYRNKAGEALVYMGGPSDPAKWSEFVGQFAAPKFNRSLSEYQAK